MELAKQKEKIDKTKEYFKLKAQLNSLSEIKEELTKKTVKIEKVEKEKKDLEEELSSQYSLFEQFPENADAFLFELYYCPPERRADIRFKS